MVLGSLTQYRSSAADLLKQSLSPDAAISCSVLFDKQGGRDQSRPSWHCEALPSRSWNLSGKLTFFLNYFPFSAGLELLKEFGNVDCSYNMSPEELCAKVPLCDALIVRSGTKVPAFLSFLFLSNTFCWSWQGWYAQIWPLTNKFVLDCEMWAFNFAKEFHNWFDFFLSIF